MKTFVKGLVLTVIQFAVVIGIAAGLSDCGGEKHGGKTVHGSDDVTDTKTITTTTDVATGGGGGPQAVSGAPTGMIKGMVKYKGDAPRRRKNAEIDTFKGCLLPHKGQPVFMENTAIVGADGSLENVFVYIDKFPKTGDGKTMPAFVLDQLGCVYKPHVIGIMTNQKFEVRNSDAENHNINVTPRSNRPFNQAQAKGQKPFTKTFRRPEQKVPITCNVHSWMNAVLYVMNHPHFAVAGKGGTFAFPEKVPPGNYTLVAEHEKLGKKTQQIEVVEGENTFTFEFP